MLVRGCLRLLGFILSPLAHAGANPDAFQRSRKEACFSDHGGAEASS